MYNNKQKYNNKDSDNTEEDELISSDYLYYYYYELIESDQFKYTTKSETYSIILKNGNLFKMIEVFGNSFSIDMNIKMVYEKFSYNKKNNEYLICIKTHLLEYFRYYIHKKFFWNYRVLDRSKSEIELVEKKVETFVNFKINFYVIKHDKRNYIDLVLKILTKYNSDFILLLSSQKKIKGTLMIKETDDNNIKEIGFIRF